MIKSFITGICGFVGSHLAEYLLSKDEEVHGLKRWRSPLDNINHILPKIHLYDGDLLELKSLIDILKKVKPDYIYHLAAQSYVPHSFAAPNQTLEVNVIGTVNLYEAIKYANIDPVIHFCGSSEAYGQVEEKDLPIKETQAFNPASPYGVSKAAGDLASLSYYKTHKLKIIRSRAFTHTGPRRGEVFVVSAFAKQITQIEAGIKKQPIIEVGNLSSVRTFLDVRDIVEAYYLLVREGAHGEAYNIAGDFTMTVGDMLKRLIEYSGCSDYIKIETKENLLRPTDVILQVPDVTKFRKATEWYPSYAFDTTLIDTLDYWRKKIRR
jgi:GDP-mannose 4,6-dehydratase